MGLDVFSAIAGVYFIKGIEKAIAGVNAVLNLLLSVQFVRMTRSFVFKVVVKTAREWNCAMRSMKAQINSEAFYAKAKRMARLLFLSASSMALSTLVVM